MSRRIKALEVRLSPHRVAVATTAGRMRPEFQHGGTGSPLKLVDRKAPVRPKGWVRVEPTLSGVCASDRKMLTVTGMGTTLMALYGMPRRFVPGHEVVGVVSEADRGAGVSVGDRVVVEPLMGCVEKGQPPCPRCQDGQDHLCQHFSDAGQDDSGFGMGWHRLGGGWATELVAPRSRVYALPRALDDRSAVLTEPFAVAAHGVARNLPEKGARVLVIGPGAIGLAVVHSLAALAPDVEVTVAALDDRNDALAIRGGATHTLHGTKASLVDAAAEQLGTTVRGNRLSGPILEHGFDVVYDCVGLPQTIDDGFRMTRPHGRFVLLGTSTNAKVDWSLVWHRELTVTGTFAYGTEDVTDRAAIGAGRRRGFEVALDVLQHADAGHLVTHVFQLHEPVDALATSAAGPAAHAVKVAFAPQGDAAVHSA